MSVETKPNKLVKGLVLDTFHTDVDNTVATYALNAQLEDQEGNHFHYGSEVGTTYIKEIPANHVVVGHINMERNETVLFTTDGTNSTIGILSRNDDMSYQYEIKVDDSKQTKKLGFKKNTYIRGVYRLLNGCDKVIYFVDGVNKDRRININQLDSYKTSDIEYIPPVVIPEEVIPEIPIIVDNTLQVIVYALSSATGNIQLIRLMSASPEATANVLANLTVGAENIKLLDVSANGIGTALANLIRTANLISSTNATGISTVNVDIIKLLQTNVTAQATTIVDTIVTKIIDAQVQALANTTASAQISISVNATVDAVTETSATVQLSKVISTSVDALANSSSEALIGLVLVSTNTGSASISTADLYINRLLTSSVTAQGTTTAELIIAELLSSAMTASANTTANLQLADVLTTSVSATATQVSNIDVIDGDAAAFFARVTTDGGTLSSNEKTAINTLVVQMKADGIWTKMKAIYPMVGASAAACKQNLKSSSFTGTFTAGWTFASSGATPNGTSAYMDTGFIPSVDNIANSAHMSFYSRTNITTSTISMGGYSTNYNQIAPSFNGITYLNINNTGSSTVVNTSSNSLGLFLASRTSDTIVMGQINTTQIAGSAATTRDVFNIYIGAVNTNGNPLYFDTKQCAFASIGDGLTDTEAANFYTAVQAFQTSLSRQV